MASSPILGCGGRQRLLPRALARRTSTTWRCRLTHESAVMAGTCRVRVSGKGRVARRRAGLVARGDLFASRSPRVRRVPPTRTDLPTLVRWAALDWQLSAMLDAAGAEIDATANDASAAERIAGALRANVERAATAVIDHFGRAFGPRLLAFDGEVARRVAEVQLYVRQHGGERDLARLGQLACELAGTT